MTRIPDGTPVRFVRRNVSLTGVVVDAITFNGKASYVVRTDDGRVYDVWPTMQIHQLGA